MIYAHGACAERDEVCPAGASEVYFVSEVIRGIVKFCLSAKWENLTSLVQSTNFTAQATSHAPSANFTAAGYVGVLCSLYGREEV